MSDLQKLLAVKKDDYEAMLKSAVDLYSAGNLKEAEVILVGLMALDERDARPVKLLASAQMLAQHHREAERLFEHALGLDPEDMYVIVALGEIKLLAMQLDQALPLFERLFAMDPKGQHPAANRGRQLVRELHRKMGSSQ